MATVAAPQDSQLVIPFCTVATFKAHPTYLDLNNLRSGDSVAADQDAELFNCLLIASAQVENFCNQPIQAHLQTDQSREFIDRYGRLKLHATDGPVRTVLSYGWGSSLGSVNSFASPSFWIEDGHQIILEVGNSNLSWSGSLQFGTPPTGMELYVTRTYVAGYANAVSVGTSLAGATSITVSNPTGIFAGDTLRIWEPGKEESVVVGSGWAGQNTSPFTSASIPISATAFAHAAGVGVSGADGNLIDATIYTTIDGLQRYGTASAAWPGAKVKAATGKRTDDASSWMQKALTSLLTYRRTV